MDRAGRAITTERKVCPKCHQKTLYKGPRTRKGGTIRWQCGGTPKLPYCYSTTDPTRPYRGRDSKPKDGADRNPRFRVPMGNVSNLIVTAAQNATPVHKDFFRSLRTLRDYLDGTIAVIPLRYKNATSLWTRSQENEERWLVPTEYLHNYRKQLNSNLVLVGDVKLQPTMQSPLNGWEGLTHGESSIFGHTKIQVRSIPTPQNRYPKLMYTTGACTVANYTDTGAGKRGEFHHCLGALLVQIQGSQFYIHQLFGRESDGAFCWMDKIFYPDGTYDDHVDSQAIIFGDVHYRFSDPTVVDATFRKDGLVETLNPGVMIFHDLMDGYAINPHHLGRPFIGVAKHHAGYDNVKQEIEETIAWLRKVTGDRKSIVVASNHDDMLARWVEQANWKNDPENAQTYLETALQMVKSAEMGERGAEVKDPFQFWVEKLRQDYNIRCLTRNQSFTVAGIECSLHGDHGPNGARGTIKNLSQLGVRVISGHGHSPGWEGGHTRVGTMTHLGLEYTGPVGSWMNTHGSIDAHGQRHLHNIINGKFVILP